MRVVARSAVAVGCRGQPFEGGGEVGLASADACVKTGASGAAEGRITTTAVGVGRNYEDRATSVESAARQVVAASAATSTIAGRAISIARSSFATRSSISEASSTSTGPAARSYTESLAFAR